jgi:hypothetical protein
MPNLARLTIPIAELLVTTEPVENLRPKRIKGRFLRGPVDWDWLITAARLPGRALHLAVAISYLDGFKRSGTVKLRPSVVRELGMDRHASYRALKQLEDAGLLSVVRARGKAPAVTMRYPKKIDPVKSPPFHRNSSPDSMFDHEAAS